ncbi:hypothetical protein [Streptomyces sp. NPDC088785]|uniref:hypothetical protein n=1 Tax=Streptomyces sp. NPDC088785 TaxID=3365897 RepID=UPI0037F4BD47
MYRIRGGRRVLLAAVPVLLVWGTTGCDQEEGTPAPTRGQIVGSWANRGGDLITFREGGRGVISRGAQLQLSDLMKKADTKPECSFSWGVDPVPAGGDTWISVRFAAGECGPVPGEFGLYYYHEEKSGELRLSPAVEFPPPGEIYVRKGRAVPSAEPTTSA